MERKIAVMKLFGVLLTQTCQKNDILVVQEVIFCVGVESDECFNVDDNIIIWLVIAKEISEKSKALKKFLFSCSPNVYVSLLIDCMSWSNSALMRFFLLENYFSLLVCLF